MRLEVRIDDDMCMGVGTCISLAPAVFRWNASKTQAQVVEPYTVDDDDVRDAVSSCPNFAIAVEEVEGGPA